ncbi:MAG: hypothetical protein ACKO7N_10825 [Candidatus Nitrosotenuis sp.]
MKKILLIIGGALIVFGILFQYQGRGLIGPESSFMYYNKDWIFYGAGIWITGIIICASFVLLYIRSKLMVKQM